MSVRQMMMGRKPAAGGGGGGVLLADDFNRADGGLGANWVNLSGSASIVSNQAQVTSPTEASARHLTPLDTADQFCELEYVSRTGTYLFPLVNVFVRLQDDETESGYQFLQFSDEGSSSSTARRIAKVVNGVQTNLVTASTLVTPPFTARLEVVGTALTAFINGVEVLTTTDSTFSGGSYVGIGGPGSAVITDNFAAGDL